MERPILFSTPMVQAILRGDKTQTRRVIKPPAEVHVLTDGIAVTRPRKFPGEYCRFHPLDCPYGEPGDVLWVRETWTTYQTVDYIRKPDGRAFSEVSDGMYAYKADGFETIEDLRTHIRLMSDCGCEEVLIDGDRWRPSIHLPRKAARLFLRVKDVRVERLQEITEEDAKAEGAIPSPESLSDGALCDYCPIEGPKEHVSPTGYHSCEGSCCKEAYERYVESNYKDEFADLWDSINQKRGYGWEVNPWVWVVAFEVTE